MGRLLQFFIAFCLLIPYPAFLLRSDTAQTTSYPVKAQWEMDPLLVQPAPAPEQTDPIPSRGTITADASSDIPSGTSSAVELQTAITEFSITIPAISLSHMVTPFVDPSDAATYLPIMATSIAHGAYTAVPSNPTGNTYLFAHSKPLVNDTVADGAWFSRIDELTTGDAIFVKYNGKTYYYAVTTSRIVDPNETSVYTAISAYPGSRSLTLQTCYPRGSTSSRLLVYAIGE